MPEPGGERMSAEEREWGVRIARIALDAQEDLDKSGWGGYAWEHLGDAWREFAPVARALLEAEQESAALREALTRVRDWIRDGKGSESEAAEAMDAALAQSRQP